MNHAQSKNDTICKSVSPDLSAEPSLDNSECDITGVFLLPSSSNEASPATVSRMSLGYSANSAFAPVSTSKLPQTNVKCASQISVNDIRGFQSCAKSAKRQLGSLYSEDSSVVKPKKGLFETSNQSHSSVIKPVHGPLGTLSTVKGDCNHNAIQATDGNGGTQLTLYEQIHELQQMFGEIIHLANMVEKESKRSIDEIQSQK